jgi:hypothetical protein
MRILSHLKLVTVTIENILNFRLNKRNFCSPRRGPTSKIDGTIGGTICGTNTTPATEIRRIYLYLGEF